MKGCNLFEPQVDDDVFDMFQCFSHMDEQNMKLDSEKGRE